MTPEEAAAATDSLFLDVREPYEWEAGHIADSVHIPIGQIRERFSEIGNAQHVVVVCQVGQRSALVADFLNANGYHADNLEGGLEAWLAAGFALGGAERGSLIDGWARDLEGRRLDGS
jgi:rhodanese-related sulfurtransferase